VWSPGGGVKKIETRKLEWDKQSKVGSTNNINHKPGGGKVKVIILF
jgi:microtubule-associated protein tau